MGADLKAEAMSHLEEISVEGMRKMGQNKSVAVILPTTGNYLKYFNG
jgi:imidazolonepropionase